MRLAAAGRGRRLVWSAGAGLFVVSLVVLAPRIDVAALHRTARAAQHDAGGLALALAAYALAFGVRAQLWHRIVPQLSRAHALAALHVSLAGNHVLPLRLGEALRVASVVRRTATGLAAATASTVTLRSADVLAVVLIGAVLAPRFVSGLLGGWFWAVLVIVVAAGAAGVVWLRRLGAAGVVAVRLPGPSVLVGAGLAWVLESGVVWVAARWAGLDIGALDAVLVTAVTIASQTFAVTPGGIGTYELAATAAFGALGAPAAPALAAAVAAHAVKTAYALVTGAVATVVPTPGMFGRLRLARRSSQPGSDAAAPADGPVVLFLPAHNEEATVGAVVNRTPRSVAGRAVQVLVIDDGSTDATARVAAAAGARVISVPANAGLGAAVRTGLHAAAEQGAAAVAFCDADGEYAPEELERLVTPILAGEADYVVGSRFDGHIDRMLPHRRLGNRVLTSALRFVARVPISDGQSGYRALSAPAARVAEVIHDFNYAQVLTLDLLAKGFRYAEVPISYRFREHGRSFVRLGRYLRAVIPAVHRELNTT